MPELDNPAVPRDERHVDIESHEPRMNGPGRSNDERRPGRHLVLSKQAFLAARRIERRLNVIRYARTGPPVDQLVSFRGCFDEGI